MLSTPLVGYVNSRKNLSMALWGDPIDRRRTVSMAASSSVMAGRLSPLLICPSCLPLTTACFVTSLAHEPSFRDRTRSD